MHPTPKINVKIRRKRRNKKPSIVPWLRRKLSGMRQNGLSHLMKPSGSFALRSLCWLALQCVRLDATYNA